MEKSGIETELVLAEGTGPALGT